MSAQFFELAIDGKIVGAAPTTDAALSLNSLERYLPQDLLYEDIIQESPLMESLKSKWLSSSLSTGSLLQSDESLSDLQTEEPLSPCQYMSQDSLSEAQTDEESLSPPPKCMTPPPGLEHLSPDITELAMPAVSWIPDSSGYVQPRAEGDQVPHQALEALHALNDLVTEGHLRREDLMVHELTAQLYPFIPSNHEGTMTSLGSILHAENTCSPCAFFAKDRCHKKELCLYCHFEHDIPKSSGQRKSKRQRQKIAHKRQQLDQHRDSEEAFKQVLRL
jgi:hypothetical protein